MDFLDPTSNTSRVELTPQVSVAVKNLRLQFAYDTQLRVWGGARAILMTVHVSGMAGSLSNTIWSVERRCTFPYTTTTSCTLTAMLTLQLMESHVKPRNASVEAYTVCGKSRQHLRKATVTSTASGLTTWTREHYWLQGYYDASADRVGRL